MIRRASFSMPHLRSASLLMAFDGVRRTDHQHYSSPSSRGCDNAGIKEIPIPSRIPRACRKRGCAGTTTNSSGYCDKHRGEGWVQHQRGLSRHQRGYGSKWTVIRARILKRDKGLCQLCLRVGVVREAKTVDHIIPKAHGGTDSDNNLQSLCWPCHNAKTARERIK